MLPTPFDSWVIASVLADQPLNGELTRLSDPWRALGERLAKQPAKLRTAALEAALALQPNRDAIMNCFVNADPRGSPPSEADTHADDDWEPIRLGALPSAEPFPLDVLPIPARDLAEAAAESIGCPADFPAVAILAPASGVIGRSASLLIKSGYFASASLYVGLVGNPSSGKSPALGATLAPVWSIGQSLHEKWRPERDAWKAGKSDQRGPEPILERVVSTDPTTEALGPILAKNPRGLVLAPDEMTKWFLSMDQYKGGRGGDRPFYLSAWNGEPVYVDRAKESFGNNLINSVYSVALWRSSSRHGI
jgi:hypothetical protein